MDAYLQNLLRRYAGGDLDLSHQIARAVMRTSGIVPIPQHTNTLAEPPKSIDDLLAILTENIIPIGILAEWEDDHTVGGKVEFIVGDKLLFFDMDYCGAESLAAFAYSDSSRAYERAVTELRHQVLQLFDRSVHYDQYFSERDITPDLIDDIRFDFEQGLFAHLTIPVGRGYSRADRNITLSKFGQEAVEKSWGPFQPYTFTYDTGNVDHRWINAFTLMIAPEGSYWVYNISDHPNADYSQVVSPLPVGSPSLHRVPQKSSDW